MLLMTLAALVALGQAAPLTKAEQLQEAAGKGTRDVRGRARFDCENRLHAAVAVRHDHDAMATPAISDGLIMFRGLNNIYAIGPGR